MERFNQYEVVVGIDFGSSGSGYSFSFNNENDINHGEIFQANVDNKVPTEIILDDDYSILQFGATCQQYLKEKTYKTGHYFKNIKMHLYEKKTYIQSSNTERSFPLVIVISKVLEKLKELCLEQLSKLKGHINEETIKWVVTVPAIWEDFQKGIMMEASIKSGLVNNNTDRSLFFALEPEAASLYCSRNKDINQNYLKEGNYYIICDLGGGTGDIVTHKVGYNKSLEEIKASCGGPYGSNEIDKNIFEYLIYTIFGYRSFNDLLKKRKDLRIEEDIEVIFDQWCELERQIKMFKEGTNSEKIDKNEYFPIHCSIFQDFFENEDQDIDDLIKRYNNICFDENMQVRVKSKKRWILDFPYKIIYNYIQKQAISISNVIKDIIKNCKYQINSVIFVGGYCSNEIIISLIKKGIGNLITNYMQPSKPCLAIMDGAVLFGINPNIINTRISKYTIGQGTRSVWNEEKHSRFGKKVYDEWKKLWRCEDCFDKFIERNEKVKLDQEITRTYHMVGPRYCTLNYYKTLYPNPTFTFENGVDFIGGCKIDAGADYPEGERELKVTMKFGGTFIDVKARHVQSGKEVRTTLTFK